MDNVTHTLAGLLLADGALQLRRRRTGRPAGGRLRAVAAITGAVGANLPDLDVLYTTLRGDRLTYLLHHRGHTHTVVVALLGALALWGVARWRLGARADAERGDPADAGAAGGWLLALALVAVASHILLDWTNGYGVHPFWPASNDWHFGDAVFIAEPWLWAVAVPPLLFAAHRRGVRVGLALVLAAGLALTWSVSLVARPAALAVTLGAAAMLLLAWRVRGLGRAAVGIAGWLLVELTFFAGMRGARARFAGVDAVDVVVAPAPANPFCAGAIVVERTIAADGGAPAYRLTTATAASAPGVVPAARCAGGSDHAAPRTLPMRAAARDDRTGVVWHQTWEAPLAELAALARGNCVAAAALRFMRVPFWIAADGDAFVLGDLRFDRAPGLEFAELLVPRAPATCPRHVPPWTPPMEALLAAHEAAGAAGGVALSRAGSAPAAASRRAPRRRSSASRRRSAPGRSASPAAR